MSVTLRTSYTKAMRVAASVTGSAPYLPTPNVIASGSSSGAGSLALVDTTKDFVALGVKVGDVVFNLSVGASCFVTSVSTTQLGLPVSNFISAGIPYAVYSQTDPGTVAAYASGAVLYNPSNATVSVTATTLDNTQLTITLLAGQLSPLQVSGVNSPSTFGNLLALW